MIIGERGYVMGTFCSGTLQPSYFLTTITLKLLAIMSINIT